MEKWAQQYDYQPVALDFMMQAWSMVPGLVVLTYRQTGILISEPELLKRIMDKNQRNYVKDPEFSYKPFMPVLGNGLIVSQGVTLWHCGVFDTTSSPCTGELWKNQRILLSSAFRIEILEETAVC